MVKQKAFSLIELMVVVALIALLLAMLTPSFRNVTVLARRNACSLNIRHLSQGWVAYEAGHNNELVCGNTTVARAGWAAYGDETNPDANVRNLLIKNGLLWPYVGDLSLYRCPSDPVNHIRSYSITSIMNDPNGWGTSNKYNIRYHRFILNPGDQIVFTEEHDPRHNSNMGTWAQDPKNANTNHWVDFVANFHNGGDNLGFADGHQEFWFWTDPGTLKASTLLQFYYPDNGNTDLTRLRKFLFNKASGTY